MVIGDTFVWAHFPKTGGDSTHELFRLLGVTDAIDDTRDPAKHDSFARREQSAGIDLTASRQRIMNIRRLPAWLLSHAKHRERNNGYPVNKDRLRTGAIAPLHGAARAQRVAKRIGRVLPFVHSFVRRAVSRLLTTPGNPITADAALQGMMSGRIDHWIRLEYLVDDFLSVLSCFVEISPEQRQRVEELRPRNSGDYERDLLKWFSRDDLARIYSNNPLWTSIEREVYGHALIDQSEPAIAPSSVSLPSGFANDQSDPVHGNRKRSAPMLWVSGICDIVRSYSELHQNFARGFRHDLSRAVGMIATRGPRELLSRLRLGTYTRLIRETIGARPWLDVLSPCDAEYLHGLCPTPNCYCLIVDARKNFSPDLIRQCLGTIRSQYYTNWEVQLVLPRDINSELLDLPPDSRIRIVSEEQQSREADAWNSCVRTTDADWVGILPADARLTPDALTWMQFSRQRCPDARCVYSDSVCLDESGRCNSTQFKPDYSPEHLLACHFTGHLTVLSREALLELNGFRSVYGAAARYDLELRLVETFGINSVQHVPRAVCHLRLECDADAANHRELELLAVKHALQRRGVDAATETHPIVPSLQQITLWPREQPHVTIYIPTRNALELVQNCIQSIHEMTEYEHYSVVVINNDSDAPALHNWLQNESMAGRLTVTDYSGPFNHSEMHNLEIAEAESEFVVLMNNDIEITSSKWLEQMVATAQLDQSIGSVGALLHYPDQTVQHGGILIGYRGTAGHYHRGQPSSSPGYNGRLHCLQELTGCTAALLLIRRTAFLAVGGFDAENLPTSFNDVDLALRLRRAGYRSIYNPAVQAVHFESKTRKIDRNLEQLFHQRIQARWASELQADPFHNRNLSLVSDSFRLCRTNSPDVKADTAELAQDFKNKTRGAA